MVVADPLEMYTLSVSMLLNNAIHHALMMSGLAAVPFIFMIFSNISDAKERYSDNEVGAVALKNIEADFIIMLIVLLMFFMPNVGGELKLSTSPVITGECYEDLWNAPASELLNADSVDVDISSSVSINGIVPEVPLMLRAVHNTSTGMVASIGSVIPCVTDVRAARAKFNTLETEIPSTQDFAVAFVQQCYKPALSHALQHNMTAGKEPHELSLTSELMQSLYNNAQFAYLRHSWPYIKDNLHRWAGSYTDPEFQLEADANYGSGAAGDAPSGSVNMPCAKAYQHLSGTIFDEACEPDGLISDLFGGIVAGASSCDIGVSDAFTIMLNNMQHYVTESGETPTDAVQRIVVEKMLSPVVTAELNPGIDAYEERSQLQDRLLDGDALGVLAHVGGVFGTIGTNAYDGISVEVQRRLNPIVLVMVQGLFYFLIPIILVCKRYSASTALLVSGVIFGLEFMNIAFEYAKWIDDVLTDLVMSDLSIFESSASLAALIMHKVGMAAHTILPVVYIALLSAAGIEMSATTGAMGMSASSSATVGSQLMGQVSRLTRGLGRGKR